MATGPDPAPRSYPELQPYQLTDVNIVKQDSKPKVIAVGCYGKVLELNYHGLKCAGKIFHEELYMDTSISDKEATLRNTIREIRILASVRHPNIVQFLGVYTIKELPLPVLVMEYLHTTLRKCLEKHHPLSSEIAYTILEDVALALCYLHSKKIAHRDLSSNNILLTPDMHAKVSDLGTAKILNITPKGMNTTSPGTIYYMPPEALVDQPDYNIEIDIFSYGINAMEIFCGECPEPVERFREDSTIANDHRYRRVSEVERRQKFMDRIESGHPICDLIQKCLDSADNRPKAENVLDFVRQEKAKLDIDGDNKLEMLKMRRDLRDENKLLKKKQQSIASENSDMKFRIDELKRIIRVYESDPNVKTVRGENAVLKQELDQTRAKLREKEEECKKKTKEFWDQIGMNHDHIHELEQQRNHAITCLTSGEELHLLHHQVKLRAEELREMSPVNARGSRHPQPVELHSPMTAPQCTLIKSTLYFGGGQTQKNEGQERNQILAFNCSDNTIDRLPPCPVVHFGLGNIGGQLLAVGGRIQNTCSKKIYTLENNKRGLKWRENGIPELSRPRARVCVISQTEDDSSSCIAACGGLVVEDTKEVSTNIVEVYHRGDQHWYSITPLPKPRVALRMTTLHNTVYLMGGYAELSEKSKPDCYSIPKSKLFHKSREIAWSSLQDTPSRSATPAHICGTLLAIGGSITINGQTTKKPIHAYNQNCRSWVHIADLPSGISDATAATLPSGKVLIVGGWDKTGSVRNKNVFLVEITHRN